MNKIFLILLTLAFTSIAFAQSAEEKAKKLGERQNIIDEINQEMEARVVFDFLRKLNIKIKARMKKDKPISAMKYLSSAGSIKKILNYRWLVADTGISKKWLRNVHELLAYMSKTRSYMQTAEFNGHTSTEKYKKAVEYFDLAYKRFVALLKKPVKVSVKVKQDAMVKKDMWQRAMRKKYKIKETNWYE